MSETKYDMDSGWFIAYVNGIEVARAIRREPLRALLKAWGLPE